MKKMRNGPLAGLKDQSQIRDFVQKCAQLYKNRKLQTDQLDKLTQLTESTINTEFGKEISLDISAGQNGQMMFDIAKHQISQHVPLTFTKHIAVGNTAINLLLANERDPEKAFSGCADYGEEADDSEG